MKKIELGMKVKCVVTGFTGTAIGRMEHLNGCSQIAVKPQMAKGEHKMPEGVFIDEEQLVIVNDKRAKVKKTPDGGDYELCKQIKV